MIDLLKSHTGFDPKNVKNPSNIRNLYVGHNNLTHIDLLKFTNLESLDIGHNNIEEISHLPKTLKWLCIADNPIKNYDSVYELKNLEYLWAHQSDIDITECYKLKNLIQLLVDDCRNISDISVVKNFENLSILELKNNNVTDISCLKNKKLYFLNLLNNNVFDIDVLSGMGTLRKLNIKDNPIQNYTALKTLNLHRLQV